VKRRALIQSFSAAAFLQTSMRVPTISAAQPRIGETSEPSPGTVYELRVYHAAPGKLGDLLARFRDHTIRLFERHGMKSVAYWTAVDDPDKDKTLIYILRHPSREAANTNWKSFQDDPEWKSVKAKSEENGKLADTVDSTFMSMTDFSPPLG
jgi:NIPSNAP